MCEKVFKKRFLLPGSELLVIELLHTRIVL